MKHLVIAGGGFAGVWAATGTLLAGNAPMFRIAALAMMVATAGLVSQTIKIRRLSHVPPARRLPGNAVQPMLLFTATKPT